MEVSKKGRRRLALPWNADIIPPGASGKVFVGFKPVLLLQMIPTALLNTGWQGQGWHKRTHEEALSNPGDKWWRRGEECWP